MRPIGPLARDRPLATICSLLAAWLGEEHAPEDFLREWGHWIAETVQDDTRAMLAQTSALIESQRAACPAE